MVSAAEAGLEVVTGSQAQTCCASGSWKPVILAWMPKSSVQGWQSVCLDSGHIRYNHNHQVTVHGLDTGIHAGMTAFLVLAVSPSSSLTYIQKLELGTEPIKLAGRFPGLPNDPQDTFHRAPATSGSQKCRSGSPLTKFVSRQSNSVGPLTTFVTRQNYSVDWSTRAISHYCFTMAQQSCPSFHLNRSGSGKTSKVRWQIRFDAWYNLK